jgi:hypothetical protein
MLSQPLSARLLLSFCLLFLTVLCVGQEGGKHQSYLRRARLRSLQPNPSCRHRPILQSHPVVNSGSGRTVYGLLFQRPERG